MVAASRGAIVKIVMPSEAGSQRHAGKPVSRRRERRLNLARTTFRALSVFESTENVVDGQTNVSTSATETQRSSALVSPPPPHNHPFEQPLSQQHQHHA